MNQNDLAQMLEMMAAALRAMPAVTGHVAGLTAKRYKRLAVTA